MAINRAQLRKAFESGKGTTAQRLERAQTETEKAPVHQKKKKVKTRAGKDYDEEGLIKKTKRRLKELWHGEKTYLKKSTFDPEGTGYDHASAKSAGIKPDLTGHWQSRDPKTGLILKGKNHPTFYKTVAGEKKAGYEIYKGKNGRYYSRKKGKK